MPTIPDSLQAASVSAKSGNLLLPAARMMYANLYTAVLPQDETDEAKKQWQITALIPAGFDLSVIEAEIEKLIDDKIKPANAALRAKIKLPIGDTAAVASMASLAEEYPHFIRLNAKEFTKDGKRRAKPDVVDSKGQPVEEAREPEETYNGRWFRGSANAFSWKNAKGGVGVSLGLVNVQLLWHDDPLAGGKAKASSDFEAVEGADLDGMDGDFE